MIGAPYDINHCIRGINRRELIKKLGFTDGRLPPMIKYNPLYHNDYSLMKEYNGCTLLLDQKDTDGVPHATNLKGYRRYDATRSSIY